MSNQESIFIVGRGKLDSFQLTKKSQKVLLERLNWTELNFEDSELTWYEY